MKCTCDTQYECNNIDFKRCSNCLAPMWCQCKRPEAEKALALRWIPRADVTSTVMPETALEVAKEE